MEQFNELTKRRQQTITVLRELDPADIQGSYEHSLAALVKSVGKDGIELSHLKEVLPDQEKLQLARYRLGKREPYVFAKGEPNEETGTGKGWIKEVKGKSKGNTVTLTPTEDLLKEDSVTPPETTINQEGEED